MMTETGPLPGATIPTSRPERELALMEAHADLAGIAQRLEDKARETGNRTHLSTAAGVRLAAFRLIELAGREAAPDDPASDGVPAVRTEAP